ncbi:hypothetical protein V2J09_023122 [Rumex salicifolius]
MASNRQFLSIIPLFLLFSSSAIAADLYFLPVIKTTDHMRPQYHANLQIGTPLVPITLTLDVNSAYTWLSCDAVGYNRSSTYSVVHCHSSDCKSYSDDGACIDSCYSSPVSTPHCNSNQCGIPVVNPISNVIDLGRLVRDSATLLRRHSPSSSPAVTPLPRLPVGCVNAQDILKGLSKLSDGVLSLSRVPFAVQYHVASTFNVLRKFAVCLPSSTASNEAGAVYFGGGPYSSMVSLPLAVNSNSTAYHQNDPAVNYYINLVSIEIDRIPISFNSSFLSFDTNGDGGTLVSPISSYGQLRSEIYKPFVDLYVSRAKARNAKTVTSPRKEFVACFDPNSIRYDPETGRGLPVVDLVSEEGKRWRIYGSNSVVDVRGVSCLAFVEGKPLKPTAQPEVFPAVVIGGFQMEDNLVEFDAEKGKLGLLPLLLLVILLPSALSATFLLPVFKTTDHARPQYHAKLQVGTPPVQVALTVDVNSAYTWLTCSLVGYNRSSTYTTVHCNTPDCDTFSGVQAACIDCSDPATPSCNHNQCASLGFNPISYTAYLDPLVRDSATVYRRNTPASSPTKTTLRQLPISCASAGTLKGLSQYTNGILSLARAPISVAYQISSAFKVPKKFAVCLPSTASSSGAVYFGGGPYFRDVSKAMVSVPLVVNLKSSVNRFDLGDASIVQYIKVNAINIDGTPVRFNSSLLSFDSTGNGGTMVSTIEPYTKLHSEIYKPFVDVFVAKAKAKNVKIVKSARKEFAACFDPKSIKYDPKTGSGLPVIELVLEGGGKWRIFGSNSVVEVKREAWCLAFVEAGGRPKPWWTTVSPAVVIGGSQMEDNLLEFDMDRSKLGVTSSLLRLGTTCSQFKEL